MNRSSGLKMVVAGCAMALAAACGGSNNGRADADRTGTAAAQDASRSGAAASPITVIGCLQKGNGADFILTRINEPAQSVGTTGASPATGPAGGAASVVEREQLRSAAGSYRVDAESGVNLNDLVGKEVRVVGTIKENMDLPRANADSKPAEIKDGDLTRIAATSVSQTAAVCSGAESPAAGTTGSAPRR
jgi:hypothetical protein